MVTRRLGVLAALADIVCLGAGIGLSALFTQPAVAQIPQPSQVTPETLRPDAAPRSPSLIVPGPSAITAPAGSTNLTVIIDSFVVDDEFAELAPVTTAVSERIIGRPVSLAEIYATAAALERSYVASGFPLARVIVPPQHLVNHGRLRFVVVDGFIESVDVEGVDARVRRVVSERSAVLIGRRRLRLDALERALLVAGDVPGLRLTSTLDRGRSDGGVRLVLEGDYQPISGSLGFDDRLSHTLGTWQSRATFSLNSVFGAGEQIYATAGAAANIDLGVDGRSPLSIYGGGLVVPIGSDGFSLNPEYTRSVTRTAAASGLPASLGSFERYVVRVREPIDLTRNASLYINAAFEMIDQQLSAPDFATRLNHDHYAVLRGGTDYAGVLPWGANWQLTASASKGLGGRSSRDAAASGIPLSRQGAAPDFTKVSASARFVQPLALGLRFDVMASGQFTGGTPQMRPEQISLDGSDQMSAFASGTFTADQGIVLRSELTRPFRVTWGGINAGVSPYLFGAVGHGWLAQATAVEQPSFTAESFGLGVRTGLESRAGGPTGSLTLELARGFTDLAGVKAGWRTNIVAASVF